MFIVPPEILKPLNVPALILFADMLPSLASDIEPLLIVERIASVARVLIMSCDVAPKELKFRLLTLATSTVSVPNFACEIAPLLIVLSIASVASVLIIS